MTYVFWPQYKAQVPAKYENSRAGLSVNGYGIPISTDLGKEEQNGLGEKVIKGCTIDESLMR
jgi:hypothetical protein